MSKNKFIYSKLAITLLLLLSFFAGVATTFTSTQDGNWNDGSTWGNASPGVQGTDWPADGDDAIISTGTTIKLTTDRVINDVTINPGGVFDYDLNTLTLDGSVSPEFVSAGTGNYNQSATWLGSPTAPDGTGDNVIISRDHTVTLTVATTLDTIYISFGAILYDNENGGDLTVNEYIKLDGEKTGNKKIKLIDGSTLDGVGSNLAKEFEVQANASIIIATTAKLYTSKEVKLKGGSTVTNYGFIECKEAKDTNGTDLWVNEVNATLISYKEIMTNGTLTATAVGNTIEYAEADVSTVQSTTSNIYHNLVISGSGVKTMESALTINGDLTISSELDASGNSITILGDWTNQGTYTNNSNLVTFNGTSDQSISNSTGEIFYDLTINKPSGTLTLSGNASVTNTLTMTIGDIYTGSDVLTLGDAATNEGNLSYTSGTVIGSFEQWVATGTTTELTIPIGTADHFRPAFPTFSDGSKTGGSVIVSFIETDPGDNGIPLKDGADSVFNTFVEGYWDITGANSFDPGTGFSLKLEGEGMSSFSIDDATRLLSRANSESDWIGEGTHGTTNGDTVQRTGLSILSAQYTLADTINCTGPVTYAITGNTEVCTGDTGETYFVILNSGNTYIWSITGGTFDGKTDTTGVNLNSIDIDWGSTGQVGSVSVYETNSCTRSNAESVNVNINTLPTSDITGSTEVSENATGVSYGVENTSGYTYTWTITGGIQASGGSTNSITIDWGESGSGLVSVVASSSCSEDAAAVTESITIYSAILSTGTGDWTNTGIWDCACEPGKDNNVQILSGHRITLPANADKEVNHLTVDAGGVIDQNDRKLKINGNFTLNGTITGNTAANKQIEIKGGANTTLDGSGTVNSTGSPSVKLKGNITILSTANLLFVGDVQVDNKKIVSNYGTVTFNASLIGGGATAVWSNEENSYLKVSEDVFTANGILKAFAYDNIVEYATTDAAGAAIITPFNGTYHHLIISGSINNQSQSDLTIKGDLTISSGDFDITTNSNNLTVGGDWINNGTFAYGSQTVTFNGTEDQSITEDITKTFYNLIVNKSSGTLSINDDITLSNSLTMTIGDINTGSNKLTLGTSTGNEGALNYTDGTIIGQFERWIAAATQDSIIFPVGTSTNYRPIEATFDDTGKNGGSVIAQFVESDPGTNGLSLTDGSETIYNTFSDGYWKLDTANGFTAYSGSNDYDLELTGAGFAAFDIHSGTRLLTRDAEDSVWEANGSHVSAVDPITKRNALTIFPGQFAFGDTTNCTGPVTPTISGTSEVCTGENTVKYYITSDKTGITNYQWTTVGGIAAGQGSDTVVVNWGSEAQIGSVSLITTNSCTSSEPANFSVNVNSIAPTDLFGSLNEPENEDSVIYAINAMVDYTYTWTITGGTIAGTDADTTALELDSIYVNWGSAGTGVITISGQKTGCSVSDQLSTNVNKYIVIKSVNTTGSWNTDTDWDCTCIPGTGDNPKILNGHTMTLDVDVTINNLVIQAGGILESSGNSLTIDGDMSVDGNINTNSGSIDIDVTGVGSTINGTGTIDPTSFQILSGNKSIASTAVLTLSNTDFELATSGISVTNNGNITIDSDLTGVAASNTWTNAASSTLKVEGVLLSTGVLNASATNNTVYYNDSTGTQNVKNPVSSHYYNLTIGGSGTKSMLANTDIDGDLLITDNGVLDVISGSDYTLNIRGDWINNSIQSDAFLQQSGTVAFDGTTLQTITGAETFYSLVINNTYIGDTLVFVDSVMVTNSFTLTSGQLVTSDTSKLKLAAGASFSYAVGTFIQDPFSRSVASTSPTILDFPIGKSDSMHRAILTVTHDATTNTEYTAEYFIGAPPVNTLPDTISHASSIGYWTITKGSGGANVTDANVQLFYLISDEVSDEAFLRVLKDNGSGAWDDLGGSGTGSPTGSITSGSFTSFSDFVLGNNESGNNPLPVELVEFYGVFNSSYIDVFWTTASELNNDYFIVERSSDGINFTALTKVWGNGTTSEKIRYKVTDTNPLTGNNYYRLKQVDYDNTTTYHKIINVRIEAVSETSIIIFPIPIINKVLNVKLSGYPAGDRIAFEMFDLNGKLIYQHELNSAGLHSDESVLEIGSNYSGVAILIVRSQFEQSKRYKVIID